MKGILKEILLYGTPILIVVTLFSIEFLIESHLELTIALIVIDVVLLVTYAHVFKNEEDRFWYL